MPEGTADVVDAGARQGRNFTPERADASVNVFEAVVAHVRALQAQRKKVVVTLWSEGSRDRMASMLADHKLASITSVNTWRTVQATPRNETMLAVLGMAIFVVCEVMFFTGLVSAFLIVRSGVPVGAWPPADQPRLPVGHRVLGARPFPGDKTRLAAVRTADLEREGNAVAHAPTITKPRAGRTARRVWPWPAPASGPRCWHRRGRSPSP